MSYEERQEARVERYLEELARWRRIRQVASWTSVVAILLMILAGCDVLCSTAYDVVRYDDAGRVVERWEDVGDPYVEGGCISFTTGCFSSATSPRQVVCGDVALVRDR